MLMKTKMKSNNLRIMLTFFFVALSVFVYSQNCRNVKDSLLTDSCYFFDASKETNFDNILLEQYFSKILYSLNEPILYNNLSDEKEIYRIILIKGSYLFVARVEKDINSCSLQIKKTSRPTDRTVGKYVLDSVYTISKIEWNNFIELINKSKFWHKTALCNHVGYDGSYWVIEGLKENKYHYLIRWSPRNKKFKKCCIYLFSLAEIE